MEDATSDDLPGITTVIPHPDRALLRLRLAENGSEDLLVARLADLIVGVVSIRWSGGCDPPNPWIYGAEVDERYRNRGVGSALWRAAEERCIARGATAASLDVDVSNVDAHRFYDRLGYRVVRRHEHRWTDIDPRTGQLRATGESDTWLFRKPLSASE